MRHSCNYTKNGIGPILDARKIIPGQSGARTNDVTYYVVKSAYVAKTAADEKRSSQRWRTSLHSGIIVDPNSQFLIDCQIYGRSQTGARLRLCSRASIPSRVQWFEDMPEQLIDAIIVY